MSKYNEGDYFYCKKEDEAKAIEKLQSEGETVFNGGHLTRGHYNLVFIKDHYDTPNFVGVAWSRPPALTMDRRLKNNITSEFFTELDDVALFISTELLLDCLLDLANNDKVSKIDIQEALDRFYLSSGNDSFDNYILDPDLDLKRQIAEKEKELETLKAKLSYV